MRGDPVVAAMASGRGAVAAVMMMVVVPGPAVMRPGLRPSEAEHTER